ncbi:hypothetical protein Moror_15546 [Moniliophthora roreri MCA 2997]|uniref:Reverse transcriptase-rnase h-integrase n=1 Tax=Moniliophthora roreri (strain MCA 2997) TaxID=1381753 RepID=V2WKA7_MONRO|nr:hypothetical protein Moror_15546 [Moniliophthora roreri MCA 2997]
MAAEETDFDKQLEVAQQLLNPNSSVTLQRITHRQRRGAIESLQESSKQAETEPEAKSSPEPNPFNELRNLYNSPSESEMTTSGSSSDQPTNPAPKVEPKVEQSDDDTQWVATITTSVIETINDKKEDVGKPLLPQLYEGDQKDTCRFLLDLEDKLENGKLENR